MRKIIPDRFMWQFRRIALTQKISGFWAHINSYADRRSSFSEFNHLYMKTWLINTSLGRYTYISGAKCGFSTIGSFCSVGPEAVIGGLGKHPTNYLSTHPAFFSTKKQAGKSFVEEDLFTEVNTTSVGNDVWVGTRAVILDGIKIGDGAIIAAGSVVTKNVPPYAIVAGVPGKVIRFRFDEKSIEKLLWLKWWDLDEDSIISISKKAQKTTEFTHSFLNQLLNEFKQNEQK